MLPGEAVEVGSSGRLRNRAAPQKERVINSGYIKLFDEQIRDVFKDALKTSLRNPGRALFFGRIKADIEKRGLPGFEPRGKPGAPTCRPS